MLKGLVLAVEQKNIKDDKTGQEKVFFKTLITIQNGDNTTLVEKYLQDRKDINKTYEVLLDRTSDLKYLNVKLGNEILFDNSEKKGIFNK